MRRDRGRRGRGRRGPRRGPRGHPDADRARASRALHRVSEAVVALSESARGARLEARSKGQGPRGRRLRRPLEGAQDCSSEGRAEGKCVVCVAQNTKSLTRAREDLLFPATQTTHFQRFRGSERNSDRAPSWLTTRSPRCQVILSWPLESARTARRPRGSIIRGSAESLRNFCGNQVPHPPPQRFRRGSAPAFAPEKRGTGREACGSAEGNPLTSSVTPYKRERRETR